MKENFYGTGVALITPFNNDKSVDYPALKKLIDFLIGNGIDYLVSLGTTGETSTLTPEEKKRVWEFTAEAVEKRVPLVAGIGGNNTSQVVSEIGNFKISGFDAILSVSPAYNKPIQEGIYQHYRTVAEASPLPIILYNVPSRTGSNMTAETTLRLASDLSNIIGIKEASGNLDQFNVILRDKPADFLFISGDDPVTLPLIALGAVGVISVIGNAVPKLLSDMVNLCLEGKFTEARQAHNRMLEITRLFFAEGSPGGVKSALKELAICSDTMRLPLVNVSASCSAEIASALKKL